MLNSLTTRAQRGSSFACGLRILATAKDEDLRQDRPLQTEKVVAPRNCMWWPNARPTVACAITGPYYTKDLSQRLAPSRSNSTTENDASPSPAAITTRS